MILDIPDLLSPAEVAAVAALCREMPFADGRSSNPANQTKNNLQADLAAPPAAEVAKIISAAYTRSRLFYDFALPKQIAAPLLARYEAGMHYGIHADVPHMKVPGARMLRSDLSSTVFIADPAAYQGGELVIYLGTQPVVMKGQAGSAVVYPSTTLHEVRPVTAGVRLVAVTFIESLIRDEAQRTLMYELNEVAVLEGLKMSWQNRVRLESVRFNLMRMWSED
ncbi:MAG: Fe2+-dependent dioxygenase [Rhodospirillaceae bacterium]|nr:Fe2+-dependent dioxygenase [Rhodospirillaceae bacterium]